MTNLAVAIAVVHQSIACKEPSMFLSTVSSWDDAQNPLVPAASAIDVDYHNEHWLCLRPDFIACFAFFFFLLACLRDGRTLCGMQKGYLYVCV